MQLQKQSVPFWIGVVFSQLAVPLILHVGTERVSL